MVGAFFVGTGSRVDFVSLGPLANAAEAKSANIGIMSIFIVDVLICLFGFAPEMIERLFLKRRMGRQTLALFFPSHCGILMDGNFFRGLAGRRCSIAHERFSSR